MDLEAWHALSERVNAPHRNSNIEVQLPGGVWQGLDDDKENLYSRMHNHPFRGMATKAQARKTYISEGDFYTRRSQQSAVSSQQQAARS